MAITLHRLSPNTDAKKPEEQNLADKWALFFGMEEIFCPLQPRQVKLEEDTNKLEEISFFQNVLGKDVEKKVLLQKRKKDFEEISFFQNRNRNRNGLGFEGYRHVMQEYPLPQYRDVIFREHIQFPWLSVEELITNMEIRSRRSG
jgi:hypothetical protein